MVVVGQSILGYAGWKSHSYYRYLKFHWLMIQFNCSGSEIRLSHCPNMTVLDPTVFRSELGVTCSRGRQDFE